MATSGYVGPEQVAISRLLENSVENFQRTVKSIQALQVIWGSFSSPEQLKQNYLVAQGKKSLLDKRKVLSETDEKFLAGLDVYSFEADSCRTWLLQRDRVPLNNSLLVEYCTALETFLKSVAQCFRLVAQHGANMEYLLIIPSKEYKQSWKFILESWEAIKGESKPRTFYREMIEALLPPDENISAISSEHECWGNVEAAFKIRNKMVHELGYLESAVQLNSGAVFYPGYVEVKTRDLAEISKSFREIAHPLTPY